MGGRRGTRGTRGCLVHALLVGNELAVLAVNRARLRLKRDVPALARRQELAVVPKTGTRLFALLLLEEPIDGTIHIVLVLFLVPRILAQVVSGRRRRGGCH